MIVVDGKNVYIRCSGDIVVAKRTIDIYVNGSGYFENLADIVFKWLITRKYVLYANAVKKFKETVKNLRVVFSRVDLQFENICDKYVSLAKFKAGYVQIDWEKVFTDLQYKVYRIKDYVKAMEMIYNISSSVSYKRLVTKRLTEEDINKMVLDVFDKFIWACKWTMNVRTVVSNSIFTLINILYNTIFKIIEYYYEGSISEKSMSYAVADLDERIVILNNCLDDLAKISWDLRYSYSRLYQLYRLLEDMAKEGRCLC